MKKQLLSVSIAGLIALSGSMPVYAEDEICVEVQTRFALANCMTEAAVSIAAAAATKNGCEARAWDVDVIVPEWYLAKLPVQGKTVVSGNGDFYELGGQSSAMLKNNVNCSIATTASGNTFDGEALTYATGSGNYYVDAVVEQNSPTICISSVKSSSDVALGDDDYDEDNSLFFSGESDEISATGWITISESAGKGKGAPSVEVSDWTVEEEVKIPDVGELEEEGIELTATSDDVGDEDCKITLSGSVENLANYIIEHEQGGLTFSGALCIGDHEACDDDEGDD